VVLAPTALEADETRATVVVSARFSSRTSLKVSSQVLQFDVRTPSQPATAVIDFSAGARTERGADVVLSIEPMRATTGPGGSADVETSLRFAGEGEGLGQGALHAQAPAIAGRWSGSGLRTGRIVFSLVAAAPGSYQLPVRLVISTP
jgi:hypothetical protein